MEIENHQSQNCWRNARNFPLSLPSGSIRHSFRSFFKRRLIGVLKRFSLLVTEYIKSFTSTLREITKLVLVQVTQYWLEKVQLFMEYSAEVEWNKASVESQTVETVSWKSGWSARKLKNLKRRLLPGGGVLSHTQHLVWSEITSPKIVAHKKVQSNQ